MSKLITLMYHSIYSTATELNDIADEDKSYALQVEEFERHLKWLSDEGVNVVDPLNKFTDLSESKNNVLITFDDGHIGFYLYAFPLLQKYGFSAIFFITTNFIGLRSEFCVWDQLDEMSRNGMSIQSHGVTHKFFSDMSRDEASNEFHVSKSEIEAKTLSDVWSISFPGGRYSADSLSLGREAGYSTFFTSDTRSTKKPLALSAKIGRYAIKSTSNISDLQNFVRPSLWFSVKFQSFSFLKFLLKRLLGNYGYHKLYKALQKSG